MSINRSNLNSEIAALLALLRTQMTLPAASQLTFVPAFLTDATRLQPTLELSEAELAGVGSSEQRQALESELAHYAKQLATGYAYLTGQPLPEWAKRFQKKDAEFYAAFFAALPGEAVVVADLTTRTGMQLSELQAKYALWQSIVATEAAQSGIATKVAQALDLRAALRGVLRLLGASQSQLDGLLE